MLAETPIARTMRNDRLDELERCFVEEFGKAVWANKKKEISQSELHRAYLRQFPHHDRNPVTLKDRWKNYTKTSDAIEYKKTL